jgi:hypothetical protein
LGLAIGLALLAALCCGVAAYCWHRRKRHAPLVAPPLGKDQAGLQQHRHQHQHQEQMLGALPLVIINPLAGERPGGKGVWSRHCDEGDVWFTNSATAESVWELPEGRLYGYIMQCKIYARKPVE